MQPTKKKSRFLFFMKIEIIQRITMEEAAKLNESSPPYSGSKNPQQRKMEGKMQKRQRIEESGGIRPRSSHSDTVMKVKSTNQYNATSSTNGRNGSTDKSNTSSNSFSTKHDLQQQQQEHQHRFGRVMEHVPCRNVPRYSTISIAIPSSILYNCQTRELKTLICGQIARAATIYHVNEIIIYKDGSTNDTNTSNNSYRRNRKNNDDERSKHRRYEDSNHPTSTNRESTENESKDKVDEQTTTTTSSKFDAQIFMGRILQYCECPQYLRKHFFPIHNDLQFTGLLAPIDAPHHVRENDKSMFREGVVLNKLPPNNVAGSYVNCGIRNRPVLIDHRLQPGIRCTVQIDPASYGRPGQIHGKVVSPLTITHKDGTYWGYTVRMASSIKAVFDECPYHDTNLQYDLTIGTSERGNETIDDPNFTLQQRYVNKSSGSYRHALIVFGGVAGIEECIDADESLMISGSNCYKMFDKWINICPYQGSRTIRSEEAILIALAKLSPYLTNAAQTASSGTTAEGTNYSKSTISIPSFDTEEQLSEESSDDDE